MLNQNYTGTNDRQPLINTGAVMTAIRLFIIAVGLGITLFGIKYSLDVFLALYAYLQQPETIAPLLERWITLLNVKQMADIYPMDKVLVIVILALGVLLLLRITLGLIHAGVSILVNAANMTGTINSNNVSPKTIVNLEYKLNRLKMMADQGLISRQAYEEIRDRHLIDKVLNE